MKTSDHADDKPESDKPKWLTVAEVAAELRLHVATVYRQIEQGQLPAVKIGRSVRIRAEELEVWLRRQSGGEGAQS